MIDRDTKINKYAKSMYENKALLSSSIVSQNLAFVLLTPSLDVHAIASLEIDAEQLVAIGRDRKREPSRSMDKKFCMLPCICQVCKR